MRIKGTAAFMVIIGITACGSGTTENLPDTGSTTTAPIVTTASPATSTTEVAATSSSTISNPTVATTTSTAPSTTTTTSTPPRATTSSTSSSTTSTTSTTTAPGTTSTVPTAQIVTMGIENFRFVPNLLTIRVGDRVRWTVTGGTHTTTSSGVWDSGAMNNGQSFDFTFSQPGTFPLFCAIHAGMQATVMVQP